MLKVMISGLLVLLLSCRQSHKESIMEPKLPYQEGFILGKEVNLQYLDWGGSGPPLILIPGLGDSPYLFEDLATSLRSNFRIISYSRRYHGKSKATDSAYDNTTLVSDLKLLLDSLKISSANLLGWSMGGNEITEFAVHYPERTGKLIYFEAGYDMSDEAFKDILKITKPFLVPDSSVYQTLDTYRKWYRSFWFPDVDWNTALEANLRASAQVNPDGSVTPIPNDSIFNKLLLSAMSYHRDYKKVQAPALVIYTRQFFVPPVKDAEVVAVYENMEKNIISPWRIRSMNSIRTELKNAIIKEMPSGSHTSLIFLSKDSLITAISTFLLNK